MVAAIDRCYYVTRRGDVSDFAIGCTAPETSPRIFQFEQIKFLCPVSRAPALIDPSLAYYREVKRRASIHPLHPLLAPTRSELQILLNPATKGRRTTGETLGIALLSRGSKLLDY